MIGYLSGRAGARARAAAPRAGGPEAMSRSHEAKRSPNAVRRGCATSEVPQHEEGGTQHRWGKADAGERGRRPVPVIPCYHRAGDASKDRAPRRRRQRMGSAARGGGGGGGGPGGCETVRLAYGGDWSGRRTV
eukprot:363079-Chlamydomonas_euryale.AAC.5